MGERPPLTASQIRQYYAEAIRETEEQQLNYLAFYEWLRVRGLRPKGSGHKEQHRSTYNVVSPPAPPRLVGAGQA